MPRTRRVTAPKGRSVKVRGIKNTPEVKKAKAELKKTLKVGEVALISQSGAVGPFPHAAGAASALSGCLMTVVAFATGSWLGSRLDGTVWPLIEGELFWAAWLVLNTVTLVRRHGEPREP